MRGMIDSLHVSIAGESFMLTARGEKRFTLSTENSLSLIRHGRRLTAQPRRRLALTFTGKRERVPQEDFSHGTRAGGRIRS
ncbi:hypothetical protein TPCV2_18570 [Cutibacterium avidum]|nr:hypothetical protein TPCV4_15250 [Cutibacterium avidum]